ncbi:MAG: hypothetical protein M1608_00735 [Candidatus Omnitrophica bacterium]|nr:hypothetical protein [Candidatus Omnitrophota bacterium]
MKMRCSGNQDDVHVALDHLLVSIEPDKTMIVVHHHLVPFGCLQPLPAALQVVLENVRHRHQLDVLACVHGVFGRPGPAPAAADQPDPDGIGSGGKGASGDGQLSRQRGAGQHGRSFQEITPGSPRRNRS